MDKSMIIKLMSNTDSFKRGMNQAVGHMNAFKRGIGQLKAMMFAAFSVHAIGSLIKNSVNTFKEFEQAMADVQAISGATGKSFQALKDSAKELGATTRYTNAEVASLQKELAKLGFTTNEILKATDAVLMLAAATGEDLGASAAVTGITLRQFGLDAEEMQRVVDVMAKSFNSTALDMNKFAESMKYIGPVAKVSGISLEEATALLGALANAGIDGSMAGTSLRQILLEIGKEGGTLSQKLEHLSKKGLSLAEANTEVGQRAMTALLVLKDQLKVTQDLTVAFEDAGGTAKKMADVQLDTLQGRLIILKSAWQGLNTEIWDGGDAMTGYEKGIEALTRGFNNLTTAIKNSREENIKFSAMEEEGGTPLSRLKDWIQNKRGMDWKGGGGQIGETPEEAEAKLVEQLRISTELGQKSVEEAERRAKAQAAALAAFKEETELRRIIFGYPNGEVASKGKFDPFAGGIGEMDAEVFNEEDFMMWKQNLEGIQGIAGSLESAFASFFSNTQGGLKAMVESFKNALAQMAAQLAAKAAIFGLLNLISGGTGSIAGLAKGVLGGRGLGEFMGFGGQALKVTGSIAGQDIFLSNNRYQSGLNGNS